MTPEEQAFIRGILEDQNRGALATILLRIRASMGDPTAQYLIGRTLMYGSGLPEPNDEHAHYWLMRALSNGHPDAARLLEIIAKNRSQLDHYRGSHTGARSWNDRISDREGKT